LAGNNLADCYALLDLTPGASEEEVRAAYLDLVKVWHPDRYAHESPRLRKRAEEKLLALNQAYERIRTGVGAPPPEPDVETKAPASVTPLSVLLYPKDFGGVWGYVNSAGRLVIQPRFDFAAPFADSLARVRQKGRWGYVDREGEYVIPPTFIDAREFSEGLAAVVFREKWGYVDKTGRYIINALYDEAGQFSGGLAAVLWRGRWGFIDRNGKFVVQPRYHAARPFNHGWADVRIGTRWGRVNRFGEVFFADAPEIGS
jgi:hypothetical protein